MKSTNRIDRPSLTSVWLWHLDQGAKAMDREWWRNKGHLSVDELQMADSYADAGARIQFLAGRALVRRALGISSGAAPAAITIIANQGKPVIAPTSPASQWHFNISHTTNFVSCVTSLTPIGIDVEPIRRPCRVEQIASKCLNKVEMDWLGDDSRTASRRFTALWTMKEAYLKAKGSGLSLAPASVRLRAQSISHVEAFIPSIDSVAWQCRLLRIDTRYWLALCCQILPSHIPCNFVTTSTFLKPGAHWCSTTSSVSSYMPPVAYAQSDVVPVSDFNFQLAKGF